jgi:hypothetical protein
LAQEARQQHWGHVVIEQVMIAGKSALTSIQSFPDVPAGNLVALLVIP